MADLRTLLETRLAEAFATLSPGADPVVRPSDRADFQANGALALAKSLGRSPRQVADEVVAAANLEDLCSVVEVSGPGFINLTLSEAFLAGRLAEMAADPRLGVARAEEPRRVVVDYSHPNVAKEMHVGHLRTTIIGDALSRVLDFCGHEVIRENHIGDWGTPFGMLIEHLVNLGETEAAQELSVGDLDTFYRQARVSFDADETFRERSRHRVVLLQSGDAETLRLWRVLVGESLRYFDEVYAKLGVLLTDEDVVGESFYNPQLTDVMAEFEAKGLLVESEGAQCVFPEGFVTRDGDPLPLIVQKSDGGFGYAATDLAAIRDRVGRLGADVLLYVVGAPQEQHLAMCFAVARMAGWLGEGAEAEHVAFGNVLGPDRKMFKTRAGTTVKLVALLDEAVARAADVLSERSQDLPAALHEKVARAVGIGAVKYADLSTERTRDYIFDWDRMLAFEGNTGPYLQYAHARICSIFRRAGAAPASGRPIIGEAAERDLALGHAGFADAVDSVVRDRAPSRLTSYLFDLASTFTTFYENCPVLRAEGEVRSSRLLLCSLTASVLSAGLGLLGIEAPQQM
ncbi:MAG: arginyl-tRNA synthetase [Acidimicrobiaceae bacterium]|nr:arginyl-tRNA synthetase [Acidimicrobiaceae bacterium]